MCGPYTNGMGSSTQGLTKSHTSEENHKLSIAPPLGWGSVNPFQPHTGLLGFVLCRSWAYNHSCHELLSPGVLSCPEDAISLCSILAYDSYNISTPLPGWSLSLKEVGYNTVVSFVAWHSTDICSLHFDSMWVSAFVTAHCTEKLLQGGLRTTLIHRYGDINLENSLMLCPFNRKIVVGPTSRACEHPTIGFWPELHDQTFALSCRAVLKYNQK